MTSSIEDMYEEVKGSDKSLKDSSEIFYCGSPDAFILVVSEAPTTSNNNRKNTLHEIIQEENMGKEIRKYYPFDYPSDPEEDRRNTLYKVFVDEILDFVDDKKENIGFIDISKEPLEDEDLVDKVDENGEEKKILEEQIDSVGPEIIVCNKKNVSLLMDKWFGKGERLNYDNNKIKTSNDLLIKDNEIKAIYSSSIHVQMSKFSRKRVSKEIKKVCQEIDESLISE